MQSKKLQNISHITTGYTFRSSINNSINGNIKVIQSKNVINFEIVESKLDTVFMNFTNMNAITKKEDVILTSRGKYQAAVIKSSQKFLVSSSAYIIRPNFSEINSEYLAIYINSIHGQNQIKKISNNGSIKTISKSDLQNLTIPILPLTQQQNIVNLYNNLRNQQKMIQQKSQFLTQVFDGVLQNKLNSI